MVGAFRNDQGQFTLSNISEIFQGQFLNAYKTSIEISLITALLGGLIGFLLAYAAIRPGTPKGVRLTLTTFSGVAANFAGVPLAFAFIATLGTLGLVTRFINDTLGYNLYDHGFSLFGLTGLSIVYLYFQIPLMILIIAPAIDGLRLEWREAAANLGASSRQYWRHVGVPLLLPSFLGAMILLFGNAFSAYATAYALSLKVNLVPLVIGQVLSGNVLSDPHLGHALAFGMIVVISFSMVVYALLQRRAARWMR